MKKAIATLICAGVVFGLVAGIANAAPDKKKSEAAQDKFIIPKEVKATIEAGLATRQAAVNTFPFAVSQTLTMPGPQQITYIYLLLNIKNADMGYAAPATPAVVDSTGNVAPTNLQTKIHTFVQFYAVENGVPGKLVKEIYIPASFEFDAAGYNPEATEWYSFGYPLNPGHYLAAIALSSEDMKRGGVQYYEFTVADPASFTENLETSSILLMKGFEQVENPETKAELHRGLLAWSIARITPNLAKTIKVGESLDMFFFIYGARPDAAGKVNLTIDFEVRQGDKAQIRFAPGEFQSQLISLPLPMKQTLEIRTGDKVETKQQDLPAGTYLMNFKITDKISGLKVEKQLEFIVE
jgi:hypothetical protein